jgi:hypothetical protein
VDGIEVMTGELPPGGSLQTTSYVGHLFVARDSIKKCKKDPRMGEVAGSMTVAHSQVNAVFDVGSREQAAARKLAELINRQVPVDVASIIDAETLELALGQIVETSEGWSARVESFFELLDFKDPPRITEEQAGNLPDSAWDVPMLIKRDGGGVSGGGRNKEVAELLSVKSLVEGHGDVLVQPSYAVSVPLNTRVPHKIDGKFNHGKLSNTVPASHSQCGDCQMPLKTFASTALRKPMRLDTPARDNKNIVLQTQALGSDTIPFAKILPRMFKASDTLHKKHYAGCSNPPAVGVAGSGRGLLWHAHAAGYNEALLGRKLWALYPPRGDATGSVTRLDCPWPPWNATEGHVEEALSAFFDSVPPPSPSQLAQGSLLRSCRDLRMTALQWIVQEMPKMTAEQRPLLFLHKPGELLWLPESWQHLTVQVDDSFYLYEASCAFVTKAQQKPFAVRVRNAMAAICDITKHFCEAKDYCHVFDPRFPNCDPPGNGRSEPATGAIGDQGVADASWGSGTVVLVCAGFAAVIGLLSWKVLGDIGPGDAKNAGKKGDKGAKQKRKKQA